MIVFCFNDLETQSNLKLSSMYFPNANSNLWVIGRVIGKDKKEQAAS